MTALDRKMFKDMEGDELTMWAACWTLVPGKPPDPKTAYLADWYADRGEYEIELGLRYGLEKGRRPYFAVDYNFQWTSGQPRADTPLGLGELIFSKLEKGVLRQEYFVYAEKIARRFYPSVKEAYYDLGKALLVLGYT